MGNSQAKQKGQVPTVDVTCCTVHEFVNARIKAHGSKVAQVDALTGEKVTFDAILERSAALAAGLSARGLRAGEAAVVIGENSVHYPWVLLGVLQTGASAHLVDPRSTGREVEHALAISRPAIALVSQSVAENAEVTRVLRDCVRSVLVWGSPAGQEQGDDVQGLPDGISSLERLLVSPAKSASSMPGSPASFDAKTPTGTTGPAGEEVPVLAMKDLLAQGLGTPSAPPPTPTSFGATYGDSCSPSSCTTAASPLQKILSSAVDGVPQSKGGNDVAMILQSSGSTGLPKGVMISHDNLLAALQLGPTFILSDDVVAGLSPYFHAFGGLIMLMALCAGTPMVALSRFSMQGLLAAVEEHKITVMHVVSSLLVSLGKLPDESLGKLASLRRIWSGAAQVSPLVQSALQTRLPGRVTLFHSYGMTETTFTVFCGEVRADKPGSPGTLVQAMECKVVDPESGKAVPMGSRGELCFKGAMVTRGYLGNPDATSEVLDAEGWLHSGDLGFVDEDGYYYIVERLKDVLKYNGHQVSPSELEALLMTHPAVSEAAVIGEPHEYGEAPRALVVLAEGQHVTEEDLQKFIAGKVAPHKQLRGGITFTTNPFPRTASGKLQRKKLRDMLQHPNDSIASSTTTAEEPSCSSPSSPVPDSTSDLKPEASLCSAEPASSNADALVTPASSTGDATVTPASSNADALVTPASPTEPLVASMQLLTMETAAEVASSSKMSTPKAVQEDAKEEEKKHEEEEEEEEERSNGPVASPEPQTQPPQTQVQYRPSLSSMTSLSTIYSESPVTSPTGGESDSSAFASSATPLLREASKIPLPLSEPSSPMDFLQMNDGSLGSGPMDLTSPLVSTFVNGRNEDSPAPSIS